MKHIRLNFEALLTDRQKVRLDDGRYANSTIQKEWLGYNRGYAEASEIYEDFIHDMDKTKFTKNKL